MHQSPQKQLGGRREKYVAALTTDDDDASPERRQQHRTSQGKARKFLWRDDGVRDDARAAGRLHPRS
jgi:hypothetical protein